MHPFLFRIFLLLHCVVAATAVDIPAELQALLDADEDWAGNTAALTFVAGFGTQAFLARCLRSRVFDGLGFSTAWPLPHRIRLASQDARMSRFIRQVWSDARQRFEIFFTQSHALHAIFRAGKVWNNRNTKGSQLVEGLKRWKDRNNVRVEIVKVPGTPTGPRNKTIDETEFRMYHSLLQPGEDGRLLISIQGRNGL